MLLGTVGVSCLFVLKANPASAASISFDSFHVNGTSWGSGTFDGLDNNADNSLTLNELTAFSYTDLDGSVSLGDLFDFGSFNLNTGVWNADAPGWGLPTGNWFTWNGGGNAVNTIWASVTITNYTPTPTSVPESSSVLGLLGVSALGASSALKRKSQQKIKA